VLNSRQQRFVGEFLIDLNGTQAAIRAGYAPRAAKVTAARLRRNVHVDRAIQLAQRERAQRTKLTQDRVLLELARIAFSDVGAVYDEYGHLLDVNNLPLGTAAAIASWDVFKKNPTAGRGTVEHIRIRFWDKVRALELLAKHLGLLDDRLEASGSLELEMKFKALDEGRARNAARTDVLALAARNER